MSAPNDSSIDFWANLWAANMLRTCIQGGVFVFLLAAFFLLIGRLRPQLPASARTGLWWLACLKMLLGLIWPIALTLTLLPPPAPLHPASRPLPLAAPATHPGIATPEPLAPVTRAIPDVRTVGKPETVVVLAPDPSVSARLYNFRPSLLPMLVLAWVIGVMVRIIGLARDAWEARRLVLHAYPCRQAQVLEEAAKLAADFGLRRSPRVLMSPTAPGPLLVGILHPVIVLPESHSLALSPEEIRMALAHEFAHLRRYDSWLSIVPAMTAALFWFYPLAWMACGEFAACREEDCDARTLRVTRRPVEEYGRLILRFLGHGRHISAGMAMSSTHFALRRRLSMLETSSLVSGGSLRVGLIILFAVAIVGLVPWRVSAEVDPTDHPLDGNPQLERKVTVHAEGLPLAELFDALERKTGVSLEARHDLKDDKLIVFTQARPLKDVLNDISAFLDGEWRHYKTEKGKDYYLLARSARSVEYEAGLAGALMARVRSRLDAQAKALDETPEQLALRSKDDPIRKSLSDSNTLLATQLYAALSSEQRDQLFQQSTLTIPFGQFAPALQESERRNFAKQLEDQQRYKDEHPEQPAGPIGKPEDLDRNGIPFDVHRYFGEIHVATFAGDIAAFSSNMQWLVPAHGNPYTGKPIPHSAALPGPKKTIEAGKQKDWPDRLRTLAELSGQSIIADYYRSKTITRPYEGQAAAGQDPETVHALDTFCYAPGYLWWTRGTTLLFRKRDWATQKQYEVPDSWLLALRAHLKAQQNVPSYHDVFSLTQLTTPQLVGLGSLKYRDEPPGQLTAGELSENDLAGFHELLMLAQWAWPDRETPLQTFRLVDKDGPELAVMNLAAMNASQQLLLASYLQKHPKAFDPGASGNLYMRMYCTGYPPPSNPTFHTGWSDVDLILSQQRDISAAPGQILQAQLYRLSLPLEIPDDRRDKTKIEALP